MIDMFSLDSPVDDKYNNWVVIIGTGRRRGRDRIQSVSITTNIVSSNPGTAVSSTNKPVRHDIAKILLKVALNTILAHFSH